MSFPIPCFPVLIVAVLGTCLFDFFHSCFQNTDRTESRVPAEENTPTDHGSESFDPFADPPMENPEPVSIKIRTKFVEAGSGTEELGIDWIVSPFGNKNNDLDTYCPSIETR